MTYRITVSSNPRSLLIIFIVVVLPVTGVLSIIFLHPVVGAIITVVGCFFSYQLSKYVINIFKSRLDTTDEGLVYKMSAKESASLAWEEISHSGYCEQEGAKPFVFVYSEVNDRLLSIPNEYDGFDRLVEELREKLDLKDVKLKATETITDYLKTFIAPPEETEDSDEIAESEEADS